MTVFSTADIPGIYTRPDCHMRLIGGLVGALGYRPRRSYGMDERTAMTRQQGGSPEPQDPVIIDCDDCAVRGPGCRDCVVSVLLGVPDTLLADERAALEVLAEAGLAPRLRLVPIHRQPRPGVA